MTVTITATVQLVVTDAVWDALESNIVDPGRSSRSFPEEGEPPTSMADIVRHSITCDLDTAAVKASVEHNLDAAVFVNTVVKRDQPPAHLDPDSVEPF